MGSYINVIILEHNVDDAGLLEYELKKSDFDFKIEVVQTKESFERVLSCFHPEIILSDYSFPTFDGLAAFRIKEQCAPDTPFIIVSGTIGEENAVELIKMGVTDYVLKDKLYQVVPKIKRALHETADRNQKQLIEQQLRQRDKQLQKLMDLSLDVICTLNQEGIFITVGASSKPVLGYSPEEILGRSILDLVHEDDKNKTCKAISGLKQGIDIVNLEHRCFRKDGRLVALLWSVRWSPDEQLGYSVAKDVTEIIKATGKIERNEKRFRALLQNSTDGLSLVTADGMMIERSSNAKKIIGYTDLDQDYDRLRLDLVHPDDFERVNEAWEQVRTIPDKFITLEYRFMMPNGSCKWFETTFHNLLHEPAVEAIVLNFRDITQRKEAEIALKENEARLKEAQEIGHIGNLEINLVNGVSFWSDEIYKLFGIEPTEVIPSYERFLTFIHPEDLTAIVGEWESSLATRKDSSGCYRIIRPDGEVRYVNSSWRYKIDNKGQAIRVLGVIQDVTERRLIEIALEESEARLLEAQAIGHIGSFEMDMVNEKTVWSDEMYRVFGVEKNDVTPSIDTYLTFVHPDDRSAILDKMEKAFSSFGSDSLDFRIVRPDCEVRYVSAEVHFEFDENNNPLRLFGIQQDITDRRRVEIALEKSEKKYRDLFNLSPVPMWLFDVISLQFIDVNKAAVRHYGYSKEEFLEMPLTDLRYREEHTELKQLIDTLKGSKGNYRYTAKHVKKNGEVIDVDIRNAAIDVNGRDIRLVIATDISQHIRYVNAIKEQNNKLKEVAWIQSHVVRAPLARLMGLVSLLKNKYTLERVNTTDIIDSISLSAYELDKIIREIVRKTEQVEDLQLLEEQTERWL